MDADGALSKALVIIQAEVAMWPAGANVLGPDEKQDLKNEAEDLIQNADQWWDTANELLAGRTPKECAEDDPDSLRDLFRSIRYVGVS